MIKSAYELGAQRALREAGLLKSGSDDAQLTPDRASAQNPAEELAQLFQEASVTPASPTPDNKTRPEGQTPESEPHWGKGVTGDTGMGQTMQQQAGMSMPRLSAI
jgi:hypothetical protein